MILEIKLRSKIKGDAALDNVARFLKRTENGWSLDRRRSGTTKQTKHTKAEQCLWRSTTRGPARSRSLLPSSNIKALKYHLSNSKSQFSRIPSVCLERQADTPSSERLLTNNARTKFSRKKSYPKAGTDLIR